MAECRLIILFAMVRVVCANSRILISSEAYEKRNDTIVVFTDIVKENKQYPPFTDVCSLRIVGGFEIPIQYAPYQIALKASYNYGKFWDTFCGGSLVTLKYVLTAAHCFVTYTSHRAISSVRVVAGTIRTISSYKTYGAESWRRIRNLWIHENYDFQNVVNDVAVIEVDRAFIKSRETQPIRLHSFGMPVNTSSGVPCAISGFGLRERFKPSPLLRMACVPLIDDMECLMYYTRYLRPTNICAGDRTKDSCQGDSGGPLVCGGVQVGIVSFGGRCAESPGVYTRVVTYTESPVLFLLTKDGCEAIRLLSVDEIALVFVCFVFNIVL